MESFGDSFDDAAHAMRTTGVSYSAAELEAYPSDPDFMADLTGSPPSKELQRLRESLQLAGLLAEYLDFPYVWCQSTNCWMPLASLAAIKQVIQHMKTIEVPVNYEIAVAPYFTYLNSAARMNKVESLAGKLSTCIGIRRYILSIEEDAVAFTEAAAVTPAPVASRVNPIIREFCVAPVLADIRFPLRWPIKRYSSIRRFFNPLMEHGQLDSDIVTVMWAIGNSLVDVTGVHKGVFLVGPAGTGKSAFIRTIAGAVGTSCQALSPEFFTSTRTMSPSDKSALCSSRMAVCADLHYNDSYLNMQNYKLGLGGDNIAGQLPARSMCSMIVGSNVICDFSDNRDWKSEAFIRRSVLVPMNTSAEEYFATLSPPESKVDRINFIIECIALRVQRPYMPISAKCVLLTIMGRSFVTYEHEFAFDTTHTDAQSHAAGYRIAEIMGMEDARTVGELAAKMSLAAVSYMQHSVRGSLVRFPVIRHVALAEGRSPV